MGLHHVGPGRAGQALQILRRQPEHAVRVAGRGPDLGKALQVAVEQQRRLARQPDRRHPADGKAGARLDELRIGAAHRRRRRAARRRSSTRRSPEVMTSTAWSSSRRRKTTLLAIWPSATPKASAASCEVRAATSSQRGAWPWPSRCNASATRWKPSARGGGVGRGGRGGRVGGMVGAGSARAEKGVAPILTDRPIEGG